MSSSARDVYLTSLDSASELAARRLAEKSGIPDSDPMWLLLREVQRSFRETAINTNEALASEPFAQRLSSTVGASIANDERVLDALTGAIRATQDASLRAIRSLELAIRDFTRRRAAAPFASIAFAVALAMTVTCAAIWTTYYVAIGYGRDLGYRAGFNDGMTYGRSHR
jgi:hypothetical protein